MIKKFDQFTNEGIKDTFKKVRSKLKEYSDSDLDTKETGLEPIDRDIQIDTDFENKLSLEEYVELDINSRFVDYTKNEINKLNLFFGMVSRDMFGVGKYFFEATNQIFGQPTYKFVGCIDKKQLADNGIIYMLNMQIIVKTKDSKGNDWVIIKYDKLEDVLEFLDTIIEK